MSEEKAPYLDRHDPRWAMLRFDDGTPCGVRVLRGTTLIEVQLRGRKKIFDIEDCKPLAIDLAHKNGYNG